MVIDNNWVAWDLSVACSLAEPFPLSLVGNFLCVHLRPLPEAHRNGNQKRRSLLVFFSLVLIFFGRVFLTGKKITLQVKEVT